LKETYLPFRYVRLLSAGLLVFTFNGAADAQESAKAAPSASKPRLGINLSGPADWNTELPFVDVFRFSRPWISQQEGAAWGKGPALALDAKGWIMRLAPGCWAETPLCTIEGGHYPSGDYTVLYDGDGALEFMNAEIVSQKPGRTVIRPNPQRGGFFLRIRHTNPADYVRNIRVLMPGTEKTTQTNPFRAGFLETWRGMASLRFMDWMQTNNSSISRWSERPKRDDATWAVKGIPVEVTVDLANRLKADPWFCMPHKADDDYVRNFARLVKQRLDPSLKVTVEYSNEVWNGMFEQSRYAGEEGKRLGFAEKPWEAAWKYTSYRSVQIFKIWEAEFGGRGRLVRVLPSQSANAYVSEQIVGFRDAYKSAGALAIAPYLSCNVAPNGKPSLAEAESWSVDQALDYLEKTALPETERWLADQKKVADRYGLKLVSYEGGQHMVGVMGGENSEKLTKTLHAANAHPRMGEIYRKYFDAWTAAGGDLFCYFSSVSQWSKWGSWGMMQFYDDNPASSPKYMAAMRWAKQRGQSVVAPKLSTR
jgi:hypothetical protein